MIHWNSNNSTYFLPKVVMKGISEVLGKHHSHFHSELSGFSWNSASFIGGLFSDRNICRNHTGPLLFPAVSSPSHVLFFSWFATIYLQVTWGQFQSYVPPYDLFLLMGVFTASHTDRGLSNICPLPRNKTYSLELFPSTPGTFKFLPRENDQNSAQTHLYKALSL